MAQERLTEPCVTIEWLLAKQRRFSYLSAFLSRSHLFIGVSVINIGQLKDRSFVNPLVLAPVKFARFGSVQKWKFLVFCLKFDSVPSKIFYLKISCVDKIRFPFLWYLLKILELTVRPWRAEKSRPIWPKITFFLFFRKKDMKILFVLCNRETFNF